MDGIILKGATHRVVGRGYLASDHISTATGLDPAFTISKNGGNFANPNAGASVMTEIEATGWYYFELAADDTGTLGPLIIRGTHATMDNIEVVYQVVETVTAANVTQWEGHAVVTHSHAEGMPVVEVHYVQADVIDATAIKDAAITANKIAGDAITNAKIADDAIAVENIKDAAIAAAKIAADAIELAKIKDGAISAAKFAANAITSTVIADDAITAAKLNTGAITADAFAANAITNAAVADDIDVNVKTITAGAIAAASFTAGAIDAAAIKDGAIDAATFAADVDAEIAAMVWNAAVASYGGAGTYGQAIEDTLADTNELQVDDTPTAVAGVKTVVDLIEDIVRNKMAVTDADGEVKLYADNNSDILYTVASCVTDNSTTTTRKRLE